MNLIFIEPLSIVHIMALILAIAAGFFAWRILNLRRESEKISKVFLIGSPNVGKKTIIKNLIGSVRIKSYPLLKNLEISFFDGKKFPSTKARDIIKNISDGKDLKELKNYADALIFVLDVSEDSSSIKKQIEFFEKVRGFYGNDVIPVINKMDIADEKKVKYVDEKIGKVIKISATKDIGVLRDFLKSRSI